MRSAGSAGPIHDDSRRGRQRLADHAVALIRLRHNRTVVVDGDFELITPEHPQVYAFARNTANDRLAVYVNLSAEAVQYEPDDRDLRAALVLTNRPSDARRSGVLAPWEARVLG